MSKSRPDRLVLAPLLIVTALAGHAGAYLLALPDGRARAAALGRTGHSYLGWTPEIVGLAGMLLVVALGLRVYAASRGARSGRIHPALALVPAGGFLLQETAERLALGDTSPAFLTGRPIVIGVLLQLALGALALAAGRLLVRSMERLGRRLARGRRPRWAPAGGTLPALGPDLLRAQPLAVKLAGRAPPAPSS